MQCLTVNDNNAVILASKQEPIKYLPHTPLEISSNKYYNDFL